MKQEEITRDAPIYVLLEYLKIHIEDKHPREKVDKYTQGYNVGRLSIIDLVESLCS